MYSRKRKRQNTGTIRRKRQKLDDDGKPKPKPLLTSVKTTLNSICLKEYQDELRHIFFDRARRVSEISVLGSLLMLHRINMVADQYIYDQVDIGFFTLNDGNDWVLNCFNSVSWENNNAPWKGQMNEEFQQKMEELHPNFEWPKRENINQALLYQRDIYVSNLKNNLFYHANRRVIYFLRLLCYEWNLEESANQERLLYDETDVHNAKWNLMENQDRTAKLIDGANKQQRIQKMNNLVDAVLKLCGPSFATNNRLTLLDYIEGDWFESIILFIQIQRRISTFKTKYQSLVAEWKLWNTQHKRAAHLKPNMPKPPKVENFTVIPLHSFKLNSFRFDHSQCVDLIHQMGVIRHNFASYDESHKYYMTNRREAWELLFYMKKIDQMCKKDQTFHYQMMVDSVQASPIFSKPKPPPINNMWYRLH